MRAEAVSSLRLVLHQPSGQLAVLQCPPGIIMAGSACNQDGRSSSLTAPNGPAQQAVLHAALRIGDVHAAGMCVLQMHGTGMSRLSSWFWGNKRSFAVFQAGSVRSQHTKCLFTDTHWDILCVGTSLGDPIEVQAAGQALAAGRTKSEPPLNLAGVKSQLGHAEPASGCVGLSAACYIMLHARVQPLIHLRSLNAHVASVMNMGTLCELTAARQASGLHTGDTLHEQVTRNLTCRHAVRKHIYVQWFGSAIIARRKEGILMQRPDANMRLLLCHAGCNMWSQLVCIPRNECTCLSDSASTRADGGSFPHTPVADAAILGCRP